MDDTKKRGRPIKRDAKRQIFSVRIKGTDAERLEFLVNEKDMSKSEIFEMGLKMVYNLKKYQ